MRRDLLWFLVLPFLGLQPSAAQVLYPEATGERLQVPRAVDGYQPTSGETTNTDPIRQTQRVIDAGTQPTTQVPGWPIASGVTAFPALTTGLLFDDNVFATHSNRRSDWAFVTRPELGVRWVGPGYNFAAQGFAEERKYARFTTEDQLNASLAVGGTVQPDADTQLVGRARYYHGHEDRGVSESLLFPPFLRPVAYDLYESAGAFNHRADRWWSSTGAAGLVVHYDNPILPGFGQIDQSYRNGNVEVVTERVGYVVAPSTSVFGEVSGNRRDFQVDNFDSKGYRAVVGMLLESGPGSTVKGEFFGGYMFQDYVGVTFRTVSTWTYGFGVSWAVTQSLTAVFEGRREAKESALLPVVAPTFCVVAVTITCGTSLIESLVGARFDYAVTQTFIVGAGATYLVDEFLAANRTDHTLSPLVSLKYLATPRLTLGLDYRYLTFDSSGLAVPSYFRNVFLASLNGRF